MHWAQAYERGVHCTRFRYVAKFNEIEMASFFAFARHGQYVCPDATNESYIIPYKTQRSRTDVVVHDNAGAGCNKGGLP